MNEHSNTSLKEVWESFIISQTSRGVSPATIKNYHNHLKGIARHIDIETPLADLTKRHLEQMVVSLLADYMTIRKGNSVVIRDETLTMDERGEAVSELESLAKSGDRYAQYLMGKLWRDDPLLTPNSTKARCWFQQAMRNIRSR